MAGLVGVVESLKQEERGKISQGTKVSQDSSGEVNRLDRTSNNGRFAKSAKDGIQVIVMMHQDAITTKELAIWPETVRTVIIVANLVI